MLEHKRGTHTNKEATRQNMYHVMYCGKVPRKKEIQRYKNDRDI